MKLSIGFLFLVVAFESLGLPYGRNVAFYFTLLISLILFVTNIHRNRNIQFPKKIFILFAIFFAFSLASVLTSVNVGKSVGYFIFYVCSFIILLYTYNNREKLEKIIIFLILTFSTIFSIYSLALTSFLVKVLPGLLPVHGYQLVFSRFGSHNHLGDFLILALTACFYYILQSKKHLIFPVLLIFFFLPYFLFSFSRSAYISLLVTLVVMIVVFIKNHSLKLTFASTSVLLFTFILSLLFFFSTNTPLARQGVFKETNDVLVKKNDLRHKSLLGGRPQILTQGLSYILERPLLGAGPGNFIYASQKLRNGSYTETAHNIFVDILVENGIPAGVVFLLIIIEFFRRSDKKLPFFLFFSFIKIFSSPEPFSIIISGGKIFR